ncbi:MAG: hypothetical protein O8C63_12140 [Candidatus Methanoperedens sp.]|nr:hypothetical protein [Candidatus Methanoperedens sp.]
MNPEKFPFEAFVQKKVEQYFQNDGFILSNEIPFLDLHVKSKDKKEEWKIECKGETKAINIDFNTGLGQILKKMEDEDSKYAIALPDIPSFRKQAEQIPKSADEIKSLLHMGKRKWRNRD